MNRGQLRVYLGAAPGVGTTCAMLQEGHRLADGGRDVVIGFVETHGRAATAAAAVGLAVIPRPPMVGGRVVCDVMDVEAVLAAEPDVVLVDDLARVAVDGLGRVRRHRDLDVLLDVGIDVLTTLDVRQLESVSDVSEAITGIRLPDTVPDHVVRAADQIQLVDLPPEQLRARLADGLLYPPDDVDARMSTLFRGANLAALREITLLWLADRVDEHVATLRAERGITDAWEIRERVLVSLTGTPDDDRVL
ncbi:MAG TPA: histidine kinase, partial [Euzebya sp.]|nr:histidine kinase [Euzebya sp.]